jgi:hypothetical protein
LKHRRLQGAAREQFLPQCLYLRELCRSFDNPYASHNLLEALSFLRGLRVLCASALAVEVAKAKGRQVRLPFVVHSNSD